MHPRYLDAKGLVALWREALLAQAVLRGQTRGYRHHPQLIRFRDQASPLGAIAQYLRAIHAEAMARDYDFAAGKISRAQSTAQLVVTTGQLEHEWKHLTGKLRVRSPVAHAGLPPIVIPDPHPSFRVIAGPIDAWERAVDRRTGK